MVALRTAGGNLHTRGVSLRLLFIPSPLLNPESWAAVAGAMEWRGYDCGLAALADDGRAPFWRQHVESAVRAVTEKDEPIVLVGHSGAGPLLPAIAERVSGRVSALVFVDAGLPADGLTRLEMMAHEGNIELATQLRVHLEGGGSYPEWTDLDLAPLIPEAALRRHVLDAQRPRALPFWTEAIPAPAGWERLPCGYSLLSPGYVPLAEKAKGRGWPVIEHDGGHFDILTEPLAVADGIEQLLRRMGISGD
jgi:pimeloyl-ACP methyl ester carboxylesterase